MWCSFCLKAVIVFFFFREVGNVLYGKLGVLNCWAGTLKGHSTHGGGDHLHIDDPRDFILHNTASTHHSYHGLDDHFWWHEFQGHLKGNCWWWVPSQGGWYLLKAWGWGHHMHWFQRLGWGWISFCQLCLQLLFQPLVLSSPCLRTPVVVPLLWFTKGQWGLSHGGDQPRGV